MNKEEYIAAVTHRVGLTRQDTERTLDAALDIVVEVLARGDEVRLVRFGSFELARRKASIGRNPRTGDIIQVPATRHVRFRPGKRLKHIQ